MSFGFTPIGRRGGATALALVLGVTLAAEKAAADHPGALWSISQVQVSVAPGAGDAQALTARVRAGLRQANETYFYGDRAVRMAVRVLSAEAMEITLTDALSGAPVGRTGPIALGGAPQAVAETALGWMDTLECTAAGCPGADGPVVAAVAAPAAADPAAETPETATATLAKNRATPVPLPVARPLAQTATVRIGRAPAAPPIHLARLDRVPLDGLVYGSDDRVVLGPPQTLAPSPEQAAATGTPTALGRLVDRVARFFGFDDPPQAQPAALRAERRRRAWRWPIPPLPCRARRPPGSRTAPPR